MTKADTLMYNPSDDTQNYKCIKRLDDQLNEPINQNSFKVSKLLKPTNKKTPL